MPAAQLTCHHLPDMGQRGGKGARIAGTGDVVAGTGHFCRQRAARAGGAKLLGQTVLGAVNKSKLQVIDEQKHACRVSSRKVR